jgi:nucleotide-binding universal stress UspA family protein
MEAAVERAAATGMGIAAVYIIDASWESCTGSDWISTGQSRCEFEEYMNASLLAEGEGLLKLFSKAAEAAGVQFVGSITEGDPAEEIIKFAAKAGASLIIAAPSLPCIKALRKRAPLPLECIQ